VQHQAPSAPGQPSAPILIKLREWQSIEQRHTTQQVLLQSSVSHDVLYPDDSTENHTRNQVKCIAQIAQASGWLNVLGKDVQEYAGGCFGPAKATYPAGELSDEKMRIWRSQYGNHFRIHIDAQWKPMQSAGDVSSQFR
jgi:hypothetical protein